jgi:hypothetical protein
MPFLAIVSQDLHIYIGEGGIKKKILKKFKKSTWASFTKSLRGRKVKVWKRSSSESLHSNYYLSSLLSSPPFLLSPSSSPSP